MNKIKVLSWTVVILIILNIGLVSFFIFTKPPHPHGPNKEPKHLIIDRLSFTDEQIEKYDLLINEHRSKVTSLEHQLKEVKEKLYTQLEHQKNDTNENLLFEEIGLIHENIEKVHFDHFVQLRAICKGDQLLAFDELISELTIIFRPPPPPKR